MRRAAARVAKGSIATGFRSWQVYSAAATRAAECARQAIQAQGQAMRLMALELVLPRPFLRQSWHLNGDEERERCGGSRAGSPAFSTPFTHRPRPIHR